MIGIIIIAIYAILIIGTIYLIFSGRNDKKSDNIEAWIIIIIAMLSVCASAWLAVKFLIN